MRTSLTAAFGVAGALLLTPTAFAQTNHRMPEPVEFFQAVGDNGSHWGRTPDTSTGVLSPLRLLHPVRSLIKKFHNRLKLSAQWAIMAAMARHISKTHH